MFYAQSGVEVSQGSVGWSKNAENGKFYLVYSRLSVLYISNGESVLGIAD